MTGILNLLAGAVGVVKDTYFNLVTLLLPGDGTNGAQNNTFLDSSSNNFTITRNGNTTQGTFSPFSQTGWSNYFDGTDDYLSIADNAVLRPGTSNFTLEAWIWRGASGAAHTIYAKGSASTGIVFQVTSTNVLRFTHTTTNIDSAGTIAENAWTHVAVVREGTGTNQTKLYINGTQDGQGTVSTDFTQTEEVRIGTNRGATEDFNGYISNLRFVKGTALYTGTFTPSTTPLTTTSQGATATEVELLTCQDNRFLDNSSNAFTITVNGTPSVQAFSPFAPTAAYSAATNGGSGYFDGDGDYLTVANNAALQLSTANNFCIEAWIYPTALANADNGIISKRQSTLEYQFAVNGSAAGATNKQIYLYNNTTAYTSGTTIPGTNTWTHVAVTWDGTTLRFFINGTLCSNTYTSFSLPSASTNSVSIGANGSAETLSGYITDARIVKGSAVYTASFTPPTAPLTAITNTSLLCNFTNAGITDATAKNVLETIGTAQISTTQSKFGGSSIYIPGTATNYVKCATSANLFDIAGVDFTIEFWVRFDSLAANRSFVSKYGNSAETAGDLGYNLEWLQSTNQLRLVLGKGTGSGDALYTWSWTPSTNTWYHVAVTRSGTSGRAFVDGTQIGTTSTVITNDVASPNSVIIGKTHTTAQYMNGYIDDLRITRGYARYTASFTPPTAAFPLQ